MTDIGADWHAAAHGPGDGDGGRVETHPSGTADDPQFMVRIHLCLPHARIHADNILPNGAGHADVHSALREAYGNARRQLQTFRAGPRLCG